MCPSSNRYSRKDPNKIRKGHCWNVSLMLPEIISINFKIETLKIKTSGVFPLMEASFHISLA